MANKIQCPNCSSYDIISRSIGDMIGFGVGFIVIGGLISAFFFGPPGLVYSTFIGLIIVVLSPLISLGVKHRYKCGNCKYQFDKEELQEKVK